jgi:hypothetical protein
MFKDASKGSPLERGAAYRHNREKRIYLPGYIAKWSTMLVLLPALVDILQQASHHGQSSCTLIACGPGILAVSALIVTMVMAVAYAFMTRWRY